MKKLFEAIVCRRDAEMFLLIQKMTIEEINERYEEKFYVQDKNGRLTSYFMLSCSALHVACVTNNTTALSVLLSFNGVDVNASFRRKEIHEKLTYGCRDVTYGCMGNWCGMDEANLSQCFNMTPIMIAAKLEHKEAFQLLVKDGRVNLERIPGMVKAHNDMLVQVLDALQKKLSDKKIKTDDRDPVKTSFEVLKDHENNFGKLLDSGEMADFNINCGKEIFRCHKIILFSQSNVLKTMIQSSFQESSTDSLTITDLDPRIVQQLIKFIYTGSIDAKDAKQNSLKLLEVADRYELKGLTKLCELELKSTIDNNNVFEMVMKADLYHADDLREACLKKIVQNGRGVVKPDGWMEELAKFPTLMMDIVKAFTS